MGGGFGSDDPQVGQVAQQLVAGGILSQSDVNLALNTLSYPADSIRTLDEVTAARVVIARQDAIQAIALWVQQSAATFMNTTVAAAASNDALPIPTHADFIASLT